MNAAATANAYKQQQILTSSPEELTLMLYNGALRFVSESMQGLERGELEKAHSTNLKAQAIIRELMVTLDMQYEISQNLYQLYDYIVYKLVQGNIKKSKADLEDAKTIITDMRDTWFQAMKQVKGQQRAVQQYG